MFDAWNMHRLRRYRVGSDHVMNRIGFEVFISETLDEQHLQNPK